MAHNMDIGYISGEKGRTTIFKRKFRWTLTISEYLGGAVDDEDVTSYMWYARTANRPTQTIEETQIDHLHERHWISGKPTWESISVTIYDVKFDGEIGSASAGERKLHEWLNSVWFFGAPTLNKKGYEPFEMGDHNNEYKLDMTLRMLDGHGETMESWLLSGAWPQTVNWGDLDYSTSDTADVEITVRFDRAKFFPGESGS